MNKKVIIPIIVVTVIIIIIAVVWGGQKFDQNGQNIQENQENQPVGDKSNGNANLSADEAEVPVVENGENGQEPEVITSDIDTSDWSIYNDTEFGFSFKYPKAWNATKFHKGEPEKDPVSSLAVIEISSVEGGLAFFVNIDDHILDINKTNLSSIFEKNYLGNDFENQWSTKQVKIGNFETKKYDNRNSRIIVPLFKNDKLIAIYWNKSFTGLDVKPEEMFDAILTSFQL